MKHYLVMTDDQGLGDLSCMGNKILKTPHIDLYKTFCELAGVILPSKMQALDGRSFLPLLKDPAAGRRRMKRMYRRMHPKLSSMIWKRIPARRPIFMKVIRRWSNVC